MGGAIADFGDSALAQITPDDTLGTESYVVTSDVVIRSLPNIVKQFGLKRCL